MKLKFRGSVKGDLEVDGNSMSSLEELEGLLTTNFETLKGKHLKLLCKGKQLSSDSDVASKVKNKSVIMVLATEATVVKDLNQAGERNVEVKEEDEYEKLLENLLSEDLDSASRLSSADATLDFEVCDQHGNPIQFPPASKNFLLKGMMFHEKGRTFLKVEQEENNSSYGNKDFSFSSNNKEQEDEGEEANNSSKLLRCALDYFLKSQENFKQTDPRLLELIDNFGYLLLDIAWTIFKLGLVPQVPDTFQKYVHGAAQSLANSHGPHLERLIHVKGFNCPERVIYCRLHFLQGLSLLYSSTNSQEQQQESGMRSEQDIQSVEQSKSTLKQALHECSSLVVDENEIQCLQSKLLDEQNLYTPKYLAIRALRSCSTASTSFMNIPSSSSSRNVDGKLMEEEEEEEEKLDDISLQRIKEASSFIIQRQLISESIQERELQEHIISKFKFFE